MAGQTTKVDELYGAQLRQQSYRLGMAKILQDVAEFGVGPKRVLRPHSIRAGRK